MSVAKKGDKVTVHYTGSLDDGTVFDSSEGREPLEVTLGSGQVIPGFDAALTGMTIGEKKNVKIPVDQAYGPRNEDMVMSVPNEQVPPDLSPEIGQKLQMGSPTGELLLVEVVDITDTHVILDANPPLAGKDLIFDLALVSIN